MTTTTRPSTPPASPGSPSDRPPTNRILYATMGMLVALLLVGAGGFLWLSGGGSGPTTIGGPFNLEDGNGKPVTDRDFRGQYMLVYFGYTFCPDVCPTTLNAVADAMDKLGPAASQVRPLFITIDPARDTPTAVGLYVHAFDPEFIGLTGDDQGIKQMAADFGVAVSKVELPGGDYTMDHSAVVFLLNDQGQVAGIFTPPFDIPRMAADLSRAAPYLPKS